MPSIIKTKSLTTAIGLLREMSTNNFEGKMNMSKRDVYHGGNMNIVGTNNLSMSTTEPIRNVFLVTKLATRFILVGQLVKELIKSHSLMMNVLYRTSTFGRKYRRITRLFIL